MATSARATRLKPTPSISEPHGQDPAAENPHRDPRGDVWEEQQPAQVVDPGRGGRVQRRRACRTLG